MSAARSMLGGTVVDIHDLTIGDDSDPDWQEAKRLAIAALASRIGGGDAITASYQDLLRWAVQDKPADLAVRRLLNFVEASIRLGTAGIALAVTDEEFDDITDALDFVAGLFDDEDDPGETFTVNL